MEPSRFDTLTKSFGRRLSRRSALRQGGAGLAATALGAAAVGRAAAQDATPVASPAGTPDPANPSDETPVIVDDATFLFVQTFTGGTFVPAAESGVYTLTLEHATAQTVYFSDRPERIVGTVPTQQFLDTLGFSPVDPPNAALVAQTDAGEDVLVVELIDPRYDEASDQLTYDARVLENYQDLGLRFIADRQGDVTIPESFGEASLFIDDCPDGQVYCINGSFGEVLHGVGMCWSWNPLGCHWCRDYSPDCNAAFPGCNGGCSAYCSGATC